MEFVNISPEILKNRKLSFNVVGTSANNPLYGVIYNIEQLRPNVVIHLINPVDVGQKRPPRPGCGWKETTELVDLNGKKSNRNYFYLFRPI